MSTFATTGAWSPQSDHPREVRAEIKQTSSKTVRENPPRFLGGLRGGRTETLAPSLGEKCSLCYEAQNGVNYLPMVGDRVFFPLSLCFNNQLVPEAGRAVWPRCHRVQKWASVYFVDWISNVAQPSGTYTGRQEAAVLDLVDNDKGKQRKTFVGL